MSENITLQKIFDLAWEHFIVGDGEPALDECLSCCYLTRNGSRCAVGLALPDAHESLSFETSFGNLVTSFPDLFDKSVLDMDYHKLCAFQNMLHDRLVDVRTRGWKDSKDVRKAEYIEVAEAYNLTVPSH